jgi:hypothetical protein
MLKAQSPRHRSPCEGSAEEASRSEAWHERLNNWLKAYVEYASDKYCPPEFHLWTGLSVLAGACERKVWLSNRRVTYYPNLFVMLTTYPGVGKSTRDSSRRSLPRDAQGVRES